MPRPDMSFNPPAPIRMDQTTMPSMDFEMAKNATALSQNLSCSGKEPKPKSYFQFTFA